MPRQRDEARDPVARARPTGTSEDSPEPAVRADHSRDPMDHDPRWAPCRKRAVPRSTALERAFLRLPKAG
jgi:hypothetical protein